MTGPIALAALFTLGGSSLKGLSGLVDDQFKDYQVFVDEKTEQLLLVRAKGDNSFQEGDTIRGYNIKLQ